MSSPARNAERNRERAERRMERCVYCGRERRPSQVWRAIQLAPDDYVCIDEASCIKAARQALETP